MSYDRLAPFYAFLEAITFGRVLQKARCAVLKGPESKRVLLLGDGNGRFLEQAVKMWPNTHFVSMDASAGMLKQAKTRINDAQVDFVHCDVFDGLKILDGECFDAVVTHFFLDCFSESELEIIVPVVTKVIGENGVWYVSDFANQKFWHRGLLWLMYRFFNTFTETDAQVLADHKKILRSDGWTFECLGSWRAGFVTAGAWRKG